MAEWWQKGNSIPLGETNFHRIINFYLFNCPCEIEKSSKKKGTKTYTKVSKRASTLRMQGWTGGHLNTLCASMKQTASGNLEYHPFKAMTDIDKEVKTIARNTPLNDVHFEMIAFAERADMNKTSAIFITSGMRLLMARFPLFQINQERYIT